MTNTNSQIDHAKWLLERTLGWIATADVKVGVAMALDTAMFGGLAAAYGASDQTTRTAWAMLMLVIACSFLAVAAFCASMAAIPRMLGPVSSNIYFARIAERKTTDYSDAFMNMSDTEFLNDLTTQIHRNSEIANQKHAWVRKSLIWSFLAALPWAISIILLVKH